MEKYMAIDLKEGKAVAFVMTSPLVNGALLQDANDIDSVNITDNSPLIVDNLLFLFIILLLFRNQ